MELINLQLTRETAEFLVDVLEFWAGEMLVAAEETVDQGPCESFEELLTLAAGMDEQKEMTTKLRTELLKGLGYV